MLRPSKGNVTGTEGDLSVREQTWEKRFRRSTRHRGNDAKWSLLFAGTLLSHSGQKNMLSSVSIASFVKKSRHSSSRQDFVAGIDRERSLNASVVILSFPQSLHWQVDLEKPRKISFMSELSRALKASSLSSHSSTSSPEECRGVYLFSAVWRPSTKIKAASWASCWCQLKISLERELIRYQ